MGQILLANKKLKTFHYENLLKMLIEKIGHIFIGPVGLQ